MTNFTDVEQSPYSAAVKINDEIVREAYNASYGKVGFAIGKHPLEVMHTALSAVLPKLMAVARNQAFEEGFEDAIEQSLGALHSYDDITRNEADHAIRKLKPDYRALSAEPAPEA